MWPMLLYLKDETVNPDFTPCMFHAHLTVTLTFFRYGYDCVLTSGRDATHMAGSLHDSGNAADYRTHHVSPMVLPQLVTDLRNALGPRYDVVLEASPPHLHVEYQPKPPQVAHV